MSDFSADPETGEPTIDFDGDGEFFTIFDLASQAQRIFLHSPFTRTPSSPWDETLADVLVQALSDAGLDVDFGLRPAPRAQSLIGNPGAEKTLSEISEVLDSAGCAAYS